MEQITVGIELGELFSRIGAFKDGKVFAVPNRMGDTSTPSIVQILDDKIIVGEQTLLNKVDPKHTITNIKSLIGKTYNEIKTMQGINYDIENNEGIIKIKVKRNGKNEFFSVSEIIALIFRKLVEDVINFMGKNCNEVTNYFDYIKAVIAIPEYFDYNQREEIKKAAKLATIDLRGFISEPTAACLSFGLGKFGNLKDSILYKDNKDKNKERNIFVFDLGGGVLNISILVVENNNFKVKFSVEDKSIKGVDFDNKLIEFFLDYICQTFPNIKIEDLKADIESMNRLKSKCIKAKTKLSSYQNVEVTLYDIFGGLNFTKEITQNNFNEICQDLYGKIEGIEDKYKINKEQIDVILLIGGTSKIPKIKKIFTEKFPNKKLIFEENEEEECIVKGATWNCHNIIKKNDIKIREVAPCSIGLSVFDEKKQSHVMSFIIKKNESLPREIDKKYRPFNGKEKSILLPFYSGEDTLAKNNTLIKEFKIDNEPNTNNITIKYKVDENGILSIKMIINQNEIEKEFNIFGNEEKNIPSKLVVSQNNNESMKIMEKIKTQRNKIEETNNYLNKLTDKNDKINCLNQLCELCKELISIYEKLQKNNDSEDIYEKLFRYTKLLIYYYTQKLIILDEDDDENEIDNMINKYKQIFQKWKSDNIEELLSSIQELNLKQNKPDQFVKLVLSCANILCDEGNKINDDEKYSRYLSKRYYIKADKILKNNIDENLKKSIIDVYDLNKLEKKIKEYLKEINAFAKAIKNQIKNNSKQSGNTLIREKIQGNKKEDLYLILDIYQEMADSFPGINSQENSQELKSKAFCLFKIMEINFNDLKNYNFNIYKKLSEKIEKIFEHKEKPDWYNDYTNLKKKIEEKDEMKIKNKSSIKEIFVKEEKELDEVYNKFINEKKPEEFIKFILNKYPIQGCADLKNKVSSSNLKEVHKEIFHKYHPYNWKSEIYSKIYMLLSNMEQLLKRRK